MSKEAGGVPGAVCLNKGFAEGAMRSVPVTKRSSLPPSGERGEISRKPQLAEGRRS